MKISIIVPFYKGNQFIPNLLKMVQKLVNALELTINDLELILVNDSPSNDIIFPNANLNFKIKKIKNITNVGIHKSRINGLRRAEGEFIIFLDQDDELLTSNYKRQYKLINQNNLDIVVGNALYDFPQKKVKLYKSLRQMNYLIKEDTFINIRDVIASPGQCIIRRKAIPSKWIEHPMNINGADDWLLWLLLFDNGVNFACNDDIVYHHKSTLAGNLSFDLDSMYSSCHEMLAILDKIGYAKEKKERLKESIRFKYLKDTNQLNLAEIIKYRKSIINNLSYKLGRYIND